ncbi:hypothetical protein ANN_23525 [Periplaneta americana]|uniref:DUF4817 domain-containing protein n=1 Tax=Periplaneta americana TaxID=6978 RepID=A0ABQ8SLD4_PERAM|nr:hypothetical protein ANN_23525 [Periplaneta americana]
MLRLVLRETIDTLTARRIFSQGNTAASRKREDRAEHFVMARGEEGKGQHGERVERVCAQLLLNAVNVERPSRLFQKSVDVRAPAETMTEEMIYYSKKEYPSGRCVLMHWQMTLCACQCLPSLNLFFYASPRRSTQKKILPARRTGLKALIPEQGGHGLGLSSHTGRSGHPTAVISLRPISWFQNPNRFRLPRDGQPISASALKTINNQTRSRLSSPCGQAPRTWARISSSLSQRRQRLLPEDLPAHAFCQDIRDVQYGNNVSVQRVGVEGKVGRVSTEFKAKANPFPCNSAFNYGGRVSTASQLMEKFAFTPTSQCDSTRKQMPGKRKRSLPSKETLRGHSDSSFRGEGYIQCCVGVRLCDMYSNQEQAKIHFMYGKADGNAALAHRLYQKRYPQRQCPDRNTFVRLHYRLCEYGKFNSPGLGRGRPRSTTPEVQEEILEAVNEDVNETSM